MIRHYSDAVGVEMDDDHLAKYTQDLAQDEGILPDSSRRIWIHTHPGDSPDPSFTDEKTFDRLSAKMDWTVMMILSRGNKSYARLRLSTHSELHKQSGQGQIYADTRLEVHIRKWNDFAIVKTLADFDPNWFYEENGLPFKDWIKEWEEKCRPMKEQPPEQKSTPAYYSGHGGTGHNGVFPDGNGTAGYLAQRKGQGQEEKAVEARELQEMNPQPYLPPAALGEAIEDCLLYVANPDEKIRLEHFEDLKLLCDTDKQAMEWWRWAERRHLIDIHHQPLRHPRKGEPPATKLKDWPGCGQASTGYLLVDLFKVGQSIDGALYSYYKMAQRYLLTAAEMDHLIALRKSDYLKFMDEVMLMEFQMNSDGWPCLLNEKGLEWAEEILLKRAASVKPTQEQEEDQVLRGMWGC